MFSKWGVSVAPSAEGTLYVDWDVLRERVAFAVGSSDMCATWSVPFVVPGPSKGFRPMMQIWVLSHMRYSMLGTSLERLSWRRCVRGLRKLGELGFVCQ